MNRNSGRGIVKSQFYAQHCVACRPIGGFFSNTPYFA